MPYDEVLAERMDGAFAATPGVTTRKMFGGLCYLVRGHMAAGIVDATLMLRVGPDAYEPCLAQPHARKMDFTGRPMRGIIYVDAAGIKTARALTRWLGHALAFVNALPPKSGKAAARRLPPRRR